MPLVHARDAAEAKVASIGVVNPRPGGALNAVAQAVKKAVARALDWHVREQVEFNRNVMSCVEAILEALNDTKRAISTLAPIRQQSAELKTELKAESNDVRSHWTQWRAEWEHKLFINETQFLRSVADLQGAFLHRATLMESNFRDIVRSQHADYLGALDRTTVDMQKQFWEEMGKIRREYERVIHEELRIIRQRAGQTAGPAPRPAAELQADQPQHEAHFDYGRFAERFRGSEDYVKKNIQFYLPKFLDRAPVLDIGCGRGEFLEMMREAGVEARGVDLSEQSVTHCRQKGLQVEQADLFAY